MRIPEVRRQLAACANDLRDGKSVKVVAKKLDFLTTELWRRAPRRRKGVPAIRTKITPELKQQIRAHIKAHPKQDMQEIGNHFNVNPGRVSEIIAGFRK